MVRGYYKRPRESAELFDEEGWCKSGDAGYYDEDGRLYISERLKQMIKCMDNQVVPSELEELLLRMHPTQIAEVSVVGLKHSEYGEAPAAAVVLTEEGKKQDLTTFINDIKATVSSDLPDEAGGDEGVSVFECHLPELGVGEHEKFSGGVYAAQVTDVRQDRQPDSSTLC
nr:4-coumarate--CoA ligase-like [Rhipicephalus microplus]